MGFIVSNQKLNALAFNILNFSIYEFITKMYLDYLFPYIDLIMDVLIENSRNGFTSMDNNQILKEIKGKYDNKDILFLTESKGRYISSWLNIMRDDLGCIDFNARSKNRTINYIPKILKQDILLEKITSPIV